MTEKLANGSERDTLLTPLLSNGWALVDGRDAIQKTFKFKDFTEAFAFMTRTALWAEKWDHHPEWSNIYNGVEVLLTTHDVNGLSIKDVQLARKMDEACI